MATIKSIEEKARLYDEAIRKAKDMLSYKEIRQEDIEYLFPALKESEDEKIRNALLEMVHDTTGDSLWVDYNVHKEDAIAWLEKQGDKVSAIEGFETEFERQVSHLIASAINREHEYNEGYVKWTATALLNFAKHELEKQGEQKSADSKIIDLDELVIELEETIGTSPHSRETIKDFFQKAVQKYMKCLQIANGEIGRLMDENYYLKEQKPAEWSKEDEDILNTIINHFKVDIECTDEDDMVRWLKSLRPQNTWKPSDEQIEALESATENCAYSEYQDCLRELIKQLKKLREE